MWTGIAETLFYLAAMAAILFELGVEWYIAVTTVKTRGVRSG